MPVLPTRTVAPRTVDGPPAGLLLLLHGYGDTENDIASLAPHVDPDGRFVVACPRAPLPTAEAGTAWFSSGPRGPEPGSFLSALGSLHETADQLCADHHLDRRHLIVGGFSQGAAMALAFALGEGPTEAPHGVLCWAGFLVDVDGLEYDWTERQGLPVLVQHGRLDETVPIELGRDTASTLEHHGLGVVLHEYDMGHQMSTEALADTHRWLTTVTI